MVIPVSSADICKICITICQCPCPHSLPLGPCDFIFPDLENRHPFAYEHGTLGQCTRGDSYHLRIFLEGKPHRIGVVNRETELRFIRCASTGDIDGKPVVPRDSRCATESASGGIECHAWRKISGTNGPCFRAIAATRGKCVTRVGLVQDGFRIDSARRNQGLHSQRLSHIVGCCKVGTSGLAGSDSCNASSGHGYDTIVRYCGYCGI